jgi:hypothetical protein
MERAWLSWRLQNPTSPDLRPGPEPESGTVRERRPVAEIPFPSTEYAGLNPGVLPYL